MKAEQEEAPQAPSKKKIVKESDLSAHVTAFWRARGYCVHGEVTVYDRNATIDHIAHTGPCTAPEHIVSLELKTAMSHALMSQLSNNDLGHYQDVQYAVTPHKKGYGADHPIFKAWREAVRVGHQKKKARGKKADQIIYPFWTPPGWITFDPKTGAVVELIEPFERENEHVVRGQKTTGMGDPYLKQNAKRLLLVEQNKGADGGVCLGAHERKVTHLSCAVDHLLENLPGIMPTRLDELRALVKRSLQDEAVWPKSARSKAGGLISRTQLIPMSKRVFKAIAPSIPKLPAHHALALLGSAPPFLKRYKAPLPTIQRAYHQIVREMIVEQMRGM